MIFVSINVFTKTHGFQAWNRNVVDIYLFSLLGITIWYTIVVYIFCMLNTHLIKRLNFLVLIFFFQEFSTWSGFVVKPEIKTAHCICIKIKNNFLKKCNREYTHIMLSVFSALMYKCNLEHVEWNVSIAEMLEIFANDINWTPCHLWTIPNDESKQTTCGEVNGALEQPCVTCIRGVRNHTDHATPKTGNGHQREVHS